MKVVQLLLLLLYLHLSDQNCCYKKTVTGSTPAELDGEYVLHEPNSNHTSIHECHDSCTYTKYDSF